MLSWYLGNTGGYSEFWDLKKLSFQNVAGWLLPKYFTKQFFQRIKLSNISVKLKISIAIEANSNWLSRKNLNPHHYCQDRRIQSTSSSPSIFWYVINDITWRSWKYSLEKLGIFQISLVWWTFWVPCEHVAVYCCILLYIYSDSFRGPHSTQKGILHQSANAEPKCFSVIGCFS